MNCFVLQDLKTRLTEEIGRLQSSVKAQGSKDKRDRTLCELEVNHRQRHNKNESNVCVCVSVCVVFVSTHLFLLSGSSQDEKE